MVNSRKLEGQHSMDVSIWGRVCVHTFLGGYTRQHLDGNHYPSVIQVKLLFVTLLFMFVYFRYALIGPNIKYWENVQVISKAS